MTQLPESSKPPSRTWHLLPPTIRVRLPLWILLASAFILLTSAAFAGLRSRSELEQVLQTDLEALAGLQAEDVERQLRQHLVRLEALASSAIVRDQIAVANNGYPTLTDQEIEERLIERNAEWTDALAAGEQRTGAQTALINQIQFHPLSSDELAPERQNLLRVAGVESEFLITDDFGALIAASNRDLLPTSFFYFDQPWWQTVQGTTRHFVRGPLTVPGDENSRYVEFAVPIRDRLSGDTIGVLYSTYNFTAIEDVIGGLQGGGSSRTVLVAADEADPALAHTIYTTSNLSDLAELNVPLAQATNALYDFTGASGTDYILTLSPVQSSLNVIDQMGWHVVALQNYEEAFAPVIQAERSAAVVAAFIGLGVILILYFLYIGPLTSSLDKLRAGAESLQSGSLQTQVDIRRNDELGVLATSFNDMARRLRQQIETQEQIINDRTASLHRQAERLRLSAEVGRAASASLDLDRLMSDTVNLISSQFGFYHATILLLDTESQKLFVRAATGDLGRRIVAEGYSLPVDEKSIVGWVSTNRKARVALDVGADPVFFDDPFLPETRSEVALPLFTRGQLLGVLDVQSRQPNDFQKEDVAILQIMADQLASNILNAQIFGESERRARLLAELQNITNLMNQQATLQNGLQVLSQQAMKLLDSDGGGVFLWNETEKKLEIVISADPQLVGRRLAPGEGLAGRAYSQNTTLKIDDYAKWRGVAPTFADVTFHSALAVPLRQQEQPIGVLILTRTRVERAFDSEDEQIIDLLAAQAGAIIVNSQLVEETRRLARRERIVNRITAEIRRSLDGQTILETATRELGQTLNDKHIRIRLFASEAAEEPGNDHPVEV